MDVCLLGEAQERAPSWTTHLAASAVTWCHRNVAKKKSQRNNQDKGEGETAAEQISVHQIKDTVKSASAALPGNISFPRLARSQQLIWLSDPGKTTRALFSLEWSNATEHNMVSVSVSHSDFIFRLHDFFAQPYLRWPPCTTSHLS